MVLLTRDYEAVMAVGEQSKAVVMILQHSSEEMSWVGDQIMTSPNTNGELDKAPLVTPLVVAGRGASANG